MLLTLTTVQPCGSVSATRCLTALTQEISPAATSSGTDRAKTVRKPKDAQSIVIDHVAELIKEPSDGGAAYGAFVPTPQMVQNMLKGMIVGSRPYVTRDKTTRRAHDYGMWIVCR